MFTPLKPWDERKGDEDSADAIAGKAMGAFMGIKEAFVFSLSPPSIPELGTSSGFTFKLQDRGGNGRDALIAARNQMLGGAMQRSEEHTSELQSLMRISYAVFCLKKKKTQQKNKSR